jgi:hypothetical protein
MLLPFEIIVAPWFVVKVNVVFAPTIVATAVPKFTIWVPNPLVSIPEASVNVLGVAKLV